MKKELCTIFLNPEGASENCDDLAKILYSLLLVWTCIMWGGFMSLYEDLRMCIR
jgi:hypothetical protein